MPSTTTYNSPAKDLIEVDRVNLVLRTKIFRNWTFRDALVNIGKQGFSPGQTDRLHILKDLSLNVKQGDRIGILGINGAGKTTLCRTIAGFYKPYSGKILKRGQIRAVFDTHLGVREDLTGRENLNLLAEFLYPGDKATQREAVASAAEFSELKEFLDAPYRVYSSGMQTRLSLSLVTAKPAEILILDEIFDGADQFFREKVSHRMRSVIDNSGAVLFVSHIPSQVMDICNRAIVLESGSLIFDGKVAEGLDFYAKRYDKN